MRAKELMEQAQLALQQKVEQLSVILFDVPYCKEPDSSYMLAVEPAMRDIEIWVRGICQEMETASEGGGEQQQQQQQQQQQEESRKTVENYKASIWNSFHEIHKALLPHLPPGQLART